MSKKKEQASKRARYILSCLKKLYKVVLATGALETTLIDEGIKGTTNKEQWIKDAIALIETTPKVKVKNIEIYNILK